MFVVRYVWLLTHSALFPVNHDSQTSESDSQVASPIYSVEPTSIRVWAYWCWGVSVYARMNSQR